MAGLDFEEGSSQRASRASPVSTATNNFTMMCWMKPEDLAVGSFGSVAVCNGDNGGPTGYSIAEVANDGATNYAGFLINGIVWVTNNAAYTTGTWVHQAIVRNAGTSYNFRDGVQQTATTASAPNTPATSFIIGDYTVAGGSDAYMDGVVTHVKHFDRVLTAQEIVVEMWKDMPAFFNNLKATYICGAGEGTGTTLSDFTQTTTTTMSTTNTPGWVDGPPVTGRE